MKQTAVEWLVNEANLLENNGWILYYIEQAKEMEKQQRGYSEEDMKQFACECVGNFLSNNNNEVEIELIEVILNRNNKQFEQFKNK